MILTLVQPRKGSSDSPRQARGWSWAARPYRATEARVLDMRVAQTGTLQAGLELRIMWDAGVAWPP